MEKYNSLREKIAAEKATRESRYAKFEEVFKEATKAGLEAGTSGVVTPMVVTEHSNPLDDNSPARRQWIVSDGACGFAWVTIRPGNCSFAKWLVKNGHARKAYYGGVDIWISAHNQSVARKELHACAMAKVFKEQLGINACPGSRLD